MKKQGFGILEGMLLSCFLGVFVLVVIHFTTGTFANKNALESQVENIIWKIKHKLSSSKDCHDFLSQIKDSTNSFDLKSMLTPHNSLVSKIEIKDPFRNGLLQIVVTFKIKDKKIKRPILIGALKKKEGGKILCYSKEDYQQRFANILACTAFNQDAVPGSKTCSPISKHDERIFQYNGKEYTWTNLLAKIVKEHNN